MAPLKTINRTMIEKEILERMFRQHFAKMLKLARTLLRGDADAEDVVQEVFARLLEMDFDVPDEKTEAYLMTSVRHGCIKRIKQMALRERIGDLQRLAELEPIDDDEPLVEVEQIRDYVDKYLTEPHKSVFNLRIDEGLTFRAIAERLDMNINTVYKHFIQCLEQIKVQFIKK